MSNATFPRMFGKYALLRQFARGGMGEICLAALGELGGLEKLCLVKRVLEADDQPSLTNRLLDEAKVAVRLNQDVDHVAVLIHGTPQILLLAVDSNEDFVQVPNIAGGPDAASVFGHSQDQTSDTRVESFHKRQ